MATNAAFLERCVRVHPDWAREADCRHRIDRSVSDREVVVSYRHCIFVSECISGRHNSDLESAGLQVFLLTNFRILNLVRAEIKNRREPV
jgi:hypothetical protein